MAFQVNTGLHTSYFLNTTAPVLLNTRTIQTNQPLQIRNENHTFEFIPEVRKNFSGDLQLTNATTIQEAGLFEVYQEDVWSMYWPGTTTVPNHKWNFVRNRN